MKLSFWEEFIIQAGISFLGTLKPKLKNTAQVAALDAAVLFLSELASGAVEIK